MKDAGRSENDLTYIPYVICKVEKKEGAPNLYLGDKAFSPDEVMNKKKGLEVDIDWYIT